MLEVKGELVFKTVAYHRAADAIGAQPGRRRRRVPAGNAAADRRASARRSATRSPSSSTTGHLRASTSGSGRRSRRPSSSCSRSRASGRRTVRLSSTRSSGIETLEDLREAAEAGRLRTLKRPLREAGAARSSRASPSLEPTAATGCSSTRPRRIIDELLDGPAATSPASSSIEPAGSFRRRRETIGDLDLLAETTTRRRSSSGSRRSASVDRVINRGGYKAAVRLLRGPQVDLMVMPPGEAGTYRDPLHGLQGAQRPAAGDGPRPGLEPVREGLPADRRGRRAADRRRRRAADVRDRGRGLRVPRPAVHRARAARGPAARSRRRWPAGCRHLIDARRPPRRPAHATPTGRDGVHPIEVMAEAARRRGYAYQVLTDHTPVARDRPRPDARSGSREQREIIADAQRAVRAPRRRPGRRPPETPRRGLPPAPRLRARDPGRRPARLRGRPPRPLRPRRRLAPRRPPPAAGRADRSGRSTRSGARTSTSSPTRPAG